MENFVDETTMPQESGFDEAQAPEQDALSSAFAELSGNDSVATEGETEPDETRHETAEPAQQIGGDEDAAIPKALRGRIKASEKRGYERGRQEVEARYRADLEELNNFRIERDVRELAEKEKISESLARRLVLAERGLKPSEQTETAPAQPRSTDTTDVNQRAQKLYDQAQTIESVTGLNVMEIFQNDAEAHRKVVSGEWDFRDIAREYGQGQQAMRAPAPVRNANRTGLKVTDFAHMSDEDFARFDAMLDVRSFDARR